MKIRKILPGDNQAIKEIIQAAILEHNAPKIGTAYSDEATRAMYQPVSYTHLTLPTTPYV